MKKLMKLSKAQEDLIPVDLEKYKKLGENTNPVDRKKAEKIVKALYKETKNGKVTKFYWFDNPMDAIKKAACLANDTDKPTKQQLLAQVDAANWGSMDASYVAFYDYISKVTGVDSSMLATAKNVVAHCGPFWSFEGCAVMSDRVDGFGKDFKGEIRKIFLRGHDAIEVNKE